MNGISSGDKKKEKKEQVLLHPSVIHLTLPKKSDPIENGPGTKLKPSNTCAMNPMAHMERHWRGGTKPKWTKEEIKDRNGYSLWAELKISHLQGPVHHLWYHVYLLIRVDEQELREG